MEMTGRTVVLTGASSGIGRATAVGLARQGAELVLLGRDPGRCQETLDEIAAATGRRDVALVQADLETLGGMQRAADEVLARVGPIHVLLNNAGVTLTTRSLTADGFETTFAVNHLAYFVLTGRLLPRLLEAENARIVSVASEAHRFGRLELDDLQSERFSGMRVYGKSKSANIHFTRELARRLEGTGVTANCLHPGGVRTRLGKGNGPVLDLVHRAAQLFLKSPEQGAATSIHLAGAAELAGRSGEYWADCKLREPAAHCRDDGTAAELWARSEEMTGLRYP